MASQDIHNQMRQLLARNVAAITSNTTSAGNIIDTQGFDAVEFLVFSGARTDGSYLPLIEHGDAANLSDAVAVPDAELLGTNITTGQEAAATIAAANAATRIGYIGTRRYVRLSIVSTGVTSGATLGAIAVLGMPRLAPTAA